MKFHFSIGGALHPATMKKKNWLRRWKGTTSSKWFTRESDGGNFRFVWFLTVLQFSQCITNACTAQQTTPVNNNTISMIFKENLPIRSFIPTFGFM
jgi:hypothetical protein